MAKKKNKKDLRLREFWNHNINPITGYKIVARAKKPSGIVTYFKRVADQASIFKPKGF